MLDPPAPSETVVGPAGTDEARDEAKAVGTAEDSVFPAAAAASPSSASGILPLSVDSIGEYFARSSRRRSSTAEFAFVSVRSASGIGGQGVVL